MAAQTTGMGARQRVRALPWLRFGIRPGERAPRRGPECVQVRSPAFSWKARETLLSPGISSNFSTWHFLPVAGQQLARRRLGNLAQQLCPAGLLVHSFAHQRRIENRPVEDHGEAPGDVAGDGGGKAEGSQGASGLGSDSVSSRLAGQRLREQRRGHAGPAVEVGLHAPCLFGAERSMRAPRCGPWRMA